MALVVGLTGGIGSGKSAAAAEFARLGATVVDTDAIAHELTQAGGAAMPAVRTLFGSDFIDGSGAMDRAKVRTRVFADSAARERLEALLHPMISAESQRRIAAASGGYVVHVIPLLVESRERGHRLDRVLVIDCPEQIQIERVRARSGLSEHEVRSIMHAQASRAARLAAADDVIDNASTLDRMREQVRTLHARYLELAQSAASRA